MELTRDQILEAIEGNYTSVLLTDGSHLRLLSEVRIKEGGWSVCFVVTKYSAVVFRGQSLAEAARYYSEALEHLKTRSF